MTKSERVLTDEMVREIEAYGQQPVIFEVSSGAEQRNGDGRVSLARIEQLEVGPPVGAERPGDVRARHARSVEAQKIGFDHAARPRSSMAVWTIPTYLFNFSRGSPSVGISARQASFNAEARERLLDDAKTARETISGVNLDEEAIDLTRYQQAYQAMARVIDTSNILFDSLLQAVQ